VALIDLGMVGRMQPSMQEQLLKLLIAISEGRSEDAADIGIKIGRPLEDFDERAFRRRVADLVSHQQSSDVQTLRIGSLVQAFTQSTGDTGIHMPVDLALFSKTLLNLDEIGRVLAPKFNPNDSIRRHAAEITHRRMMKSMTPGHLFSAAIEAKEFVEELPGRVNKILDSLANNQLKVQVEALDEATLIEGFQKVANRIATGLILAALIVGAALLMQVRTSFTLFGYPGLAILCFLAAAGGGFWLVLTILLSDRDTRRKSGGRSAYG
jgi:ubiquinone biosynthesis protein